MELYFFFISGSADTVAYSTLLCKNWQTTLQHSQRANFTNANTTTPALGYSQAVRPLAIPKPCFGP